MFYPNIYPETNKRKSYSNRVQVLSNNSLSLERAISNLEGEVHRLNQEVVELKLALAQIIDVLNNFSFTPNPVPPTEPVEPPLIEEPNPETNPHPNPELPTEKPTEPTEPISEIQEIEVTEEGFYTAINGTLWLLN